MPVWAAQYPYTEAHVYRVLQCPVDSRTASCGLGVNESEKIKEERGVRDTSGSVCYHLGKPVPTRPLRMCQFDWGEIINLLEECLLAGQGLVGQGALGDQLRKDWW